MLITDLVSFVFTCRNIYMMQLLFHNLTIKSDEDCDLNI